MTKKGKPKAKQGETREDIGELIELLEYYTHDPDERDKVADKLTKIGKPAVEPLIQALLADADLLGPPMGRRVAVARILARIGDQRAVEPLTQALEDKGSGDLRGQAAWALGNIRDKEAVEPLIDALKDDDWLVQNSAAEALGMIGNERAVEPLIKALKYKSDGLVRQQAALALAAIGDSRAVEPLTRALNYKDNGVRKAAKEALEKLKGIKG